MGGGEELCECRYVECWKYEIIYFRYQTFVGAFELYSGESRYLKYTLGRISRISTIHTDCRGESKDIQINHNTLAYRFFLVSSNPCSTLFATSSVFPAATAASTL